MLQALMTLIGLIFDILASVIKTIVTWTVVGVILVLVTISGFTAFLVHLLR